MIDLYCERLGAGLWAEPINAITNLSFVVAAIAAWHLARHRNLLTFDIQLLIGLMITIGLGSGLFHTFATLWARILDVIPILLFQIVFLWIYGFRIIKLTAFIRIGLTILFLISVYFARQFPHVLNGSLAYTPVFVLLLGLGLYHFYHTQTDRALLLWATVVFSLSLFFRTVDMVACTYTPFGTHFLWHLFTGLLTYLVVRSLLMNLPVTDRNNT